MSAIQSFVQAAKADRPVYICDVRDAFQRTGTRPFHCHVRLYDGNTRRFALKLPACEGPEEEAFVGEYLRATLYNLLSALGARSIGIYIDPSDAALADFAEGLNGTFQVDAPLAARSGYGKCLNVNQRTLASLLGPEVRFRFEVGDVAAEPRVADVPSPASAPVFAALPARAARGLFMGMDIGGTDVKLAASVDGRLVAFKEYDWNPAACGRAEQILEPLLLLTRLMRAAAAMAAEGLAGKIPVAAFGRAASDADMRAAAEAMEARLGGAPRGFDGIGLCFPDVVIRNRVIGGESHKTSGMRRNPDIDYEAEFARITGLCDALRAWVRPGGAVMNTNDGPMAAFTTAVERAAAGEALADGFFAHSLGTDLGTGWILPDGRIPEIPLEAYNFIVDLGSRGQRAFDAPDARSVNSFNTGLPGTLQRYACQSGAFRLAAMQLPEADPDAWREALDRGLFVREGGRLTVPTAPADMRKPCLEFLMARAEDPDSPCAGIFRTIGEYLGVTWRETDWVLAPACRSRTLYGRLVKTRACFDLLCEGARRIVPGLRLEAADETLANTPLMRQLAARPDYTVAQFGQAVGAIHYACTGLR